MPSDFRYGSRCDDPPEIADPVAVASPETSADRPDRKCRAATSLCRSDPCPEITLQIRLERGNAETGDVVRQPHHGDRVYLAKWISVLRV